ncbi:MAG: hypothetical protein KBF32_09775, partial [Chitinophagales bacterium]|nr:hypothetical protein [Chitinophagales bacterium]
MKQYYKFFLTTFLLLSGVSNTFSQIPEWKDVASIIYNNCTTCHRPGEIGADYLNATSYKSLVNSPYFYNIPAQVQSRLMPPWKADPEFTHFLSERILTQSEIDKLSLWIDYDAPAG